GATHYANIYIEGANPVEQGSTVSILPNQSVTIVGLDDGTAHSIERTSADSLFNIAAGSELLLQDLSISDADSAAMSGANVLCDVEGGSLSSDNVAFSGLHTAAAGVAALSGSTAAFRMGNSTVSNCTSDNSCAVVDVAAGTFTADGSAISECTSASGSAAIAVGTGATASIQDSSIQHCTTTGSDDGYAIDARTGTLQISGDTQIGASDSDRTGVLVGIQSGDEPMQITGDLGQDARINICVPTGAASGDVVAAKTDGTPVSSLDESSHFHNVDGYFVISPDTSYTTGGAIGGYILGLSTITLFGASVNGSTATSPDPPSDNVLSDTLTIELDAYMGPGGAGAEFTPGVLSTSALPSDDTLTIGTTTEDYFTYAGTATVSGTTVYEYTVPITGSWDDGDTFTLSLDQSAVSTASIYGNVSGLTLHAPMYGVTYDVNGGSGTAPTDSGTYRSGASVTVASDSGLSRTGYTVSGWNTASDGSGSSYAGSGSATLDISADTTLYAQWTPASIAISYTDDTSDTSVNIDTTGATTQADYASVLTTPATATRTGYTFSGWKVQGATSDWAFGQGGTALTEDNGVLCATGTGGTVTGTLELIAQWTLIPVPPSPTPTPTPTPTPSPAPAVVTPTTVVPGTGTLTTPGTATTQNIPANVAPLETGNIVSDIANGDVPLANTTSEPAWSLLSALFSIIALLLAIILLLLPLFTRRKRDNESGREYMSRRAAGLKALVWRVLSVIAGAATPIVWLIVDNVTSPYVFINGWTPLIGIIFVIEIALLIVYAAVYRHNKNDDSGSWNTQTLDQVVGAGE
ncbi:MAG: InlB B-repeat-containing protein, partial [Coriobacteriales bacterium]|nr:InlB B-repeat-containing protein [Coriobacteriales bacterium]